jgi:hypothetical protein
MLEHFPSSTENTLSMALIGATLIWDIFVFIQAVGILAFWSLQWEC